jgi:ribonuclease HI
MLHTRLLNHRRLLGSTKKFTVFEGELTGIILGIHLLHTSVNTHAPPNLNINNQATILTLHQNKLQPVQYLIDEIKENTIKIYKKALEAQTHAEEMDQQTTTSFTWVASHMGLVGNKAVDKLAKEAAEYRSSEQHLLPEFLHRQLPTSLSATLQQITEGTKQSNKKWWKQSKRYQTAKSINPNLPTPSFIKATKGLNRCQISMLTQLHIGHNSLNKHLHQIQQADSPKCPHCPNPNEDMSHVLLQCWKYANHRHQLTLALK